MKLHYRGDRTNYDPEQVYGPDRFGATYVVTSGEYDAERDQTTLHFKPAVSV